MTKHEGRLELTWTDKDKTLLSTGDGTYGYTFVDPADHRASEVRLLHEVDRVEAPAPVGRPTELPTPTTGNLLITGDAMHALDALAKNPEYADAYVGKVKLVYIDPPFNTGQAFAHYEDNIDHSIWLTMLRDRLRQIRPLLAEDGSIWVHLDDAELHRCRSVMDEELGAENFVTSVVWEKADSPNNSAKHLSIDQDTILIYAKNKRRWVANRLPRNAASDAIYSNPDNDPRGPWYPGDPFANKSYALGLYEVEGPTGRTFRPPKGRFWRISEARFRQFEAEQRIWWGPDNSARPSIKRFLADVSGLTPRTLWRHTAVGSNRTSKNEIRALFPGDESFATPKPERLLQRVLLIATNPGDIVLDCFAGSGTTAAVAHKMGRRWVTTELLDETAENFTKPRLLKVVRGDDGGGITTHTERQAADGVELPDDVSPEQARDFQRVLNKTLEGDDEPAITIPLAKELAKVLRRGPTGALDEDEAKTLVRLLKKADGPGTNLDVSKQVKSQLTRLTKTTEVSTQIWHGGGGFTHLRVGPSMFVEMSGMVLLADWATQGDLARAMCAQIGVTYRPDGIYAAKRGRTRYVIVDGMVGGTTVASIVDRLPEKETVEVWATQIEDDAAQALRTSRPGSRLELIPDAVLDNYRRTAARSSPFGSGRQAQSNDTNDEGTEV